MIDTRISWITDQAIMYLASGFQRRRMYHLLDIVPADLTYAVVQRGQEYIAEETLCIEKSTSLTFSSGLAAEPTGFYRMNYIELGSTSTKPPMEISLRERYRLQQVLRSKDNSSAYLSKDQWLYRWGGSIYSWPSLTDGSYTMYYWGRPTTTVDQDTAPETPAYMDRALVFWTVKEIADMIGMRDFAREYDRRFQEALDEVLISHSGATTVDDCIVASDL